MPLDAMSFRPADEPRPMPVTDPVTGAPITNPDGSAVVLMLYGQDSDVYRRITDANANRRLEHAVGGRRAKLTAEQLRAESLEVVVACTAGWEGIEWDGAPLAFSPANARKLYTALPWLQEQAEGFIGDRAHFFGPSKTSSSPTPSTSSA